MTRVFIVCATLFAVVVQAKPVTFSTSLADAIFIHNYRTNTAPGDCHYVVKRSPCHQHAQAFYLRFTRDFASALSLFPADIQKKTEVQALAQHLRDDVSLVEAGFAERGTWLQRHPLVHLKQGVVDGDNVTYEFTTRFEGDGDRVCYLDGELYIYEGRYRDIAYSLKYRGCRDED